MQRSWLQKKNGEKYICVVVSVFDTTKNVYETLKLLLSYDHSITDD